MKKLLTLLVVYSSSYAIDIGLNGGTTGIGIVAQQNIYDSINLKAKANYIDVNYNIQHLQSKSIELLLTYDISQNFYIGAGVVYNNTALSSNKTQHLCWEQVGACADLDMHKQTTLDRFMPIFEIGSKYYMTSNIYLDYSVGIIIANTYTHEKYIANANVFNQSISVWNTFDSSEKLILPKIGMSINYKF